MFLSLHCLHILAFESNFLGVAIPADLHARARRTSFIDEARDARYQCSAMAALSTLNFCTPSSRLHCQSWFVLLCVRSLTPCPQVLTYTLLHLCRLESSPQIIPSILCPPPSSDLSFLRMSRCLSERSGTTAWWGNLAGDVAWTIEPVTVIAGPYLWLKSVPPNVVKHKTQ